ncbi:Protein of uncharacterised function (DUF3118) [Bacillus freudenreichii]|nr:Protein of uncharacterised function (DUF3118) [Bacillus freudenreichii]
MISTPYNKSKKDKRIIVYIPFNNLNVRQSLLTDNIDYPNLSRDDTHLTEEWINKRISIFMKFTLKSLLNQTNQNYLAFIVYHDTSRKFIENALKNYPPLPSHIRFVPVSVYERTVIKAIRGFKYFYELHLYSDDAYHKDYINDLYRYKHKLLTKVLICQNGYIYDSVTNELSEYYNISSSFNCLIYKVKEYISGVRHNIFQPNPMGIWAAAIRLPHEIIKDRVYINHSHNDNVAFSFENEKKVQGLWIDEKGNPLNVIGSMISDENVKKHILKDFLGSEYRSNMN